MKILLATNGSEWSEVAVQEVAERMWPAGSIVRIVSVVGPSFVCNHPFAPIALDISGEIERSLTDAADAAVKHARSELTRNGDAALRVETRVLVGPPGPAIRDEAEGWGADLVVVGSHVRGAVERTLLGSVSAAVALHSRCSVEIVRCVRWRTAARGTTA